MANGGERDREGEPVGGLQITAGAAWRGRGWVTAVGGEQWQAWLSGFG